MEKVSYIDVPSGKAGTIAASQKLMELAVENSCRWDDIIPLARKIVDSVNARDQKAKADAIFEWITKNIKYQRDPLPIELYQAPHVLFRTKRGDCDCLSAMFASLNFAIGNDCRFVLIGTESEKRFDHIYCEILVGKKWVAYDCSVPNAFPGWEPNRYKCKGYIEMSGKYEENKNDNTGCNDKPCDCGSTADIYSVWSDDPRSPERTVGLTFLVDGDEDDCPDQYQHDPDIQQYIKTNYGDPYTCTGNIAAYPFVAKVQNAFKSGSNAAWVVAMSEGFTQYPDLLYKFQGHKEAAARLAQQHPFLANYSAWGTFTSQKAQQFLQQAMNNAYNNITKAQYPELAGIQAAFKSGSNSAWVVAMAKLFVKYPDLLGKFKGDAAAAKRLTAKHPILANYSGYGTFTTPQAKEYLNQAIIRAQNDILIGKYPEMYDVLDALFVSKSNIAWLLGMTKVFNAYPDLLLHYRNDAAATARIKQQHPILINYRFYGDHADGRLWWSRAVDLADKPAKLKEFIEDYIKSREDDGFFDKAKKVVEKIGKEIERGIVKATQLGIPLPLGPAATFIAINKMQRDAENQIEKAEDQADKELRIMEAQAVQKEQELVAQKEVLDQLNEKLSELNISLAEMAKKSDLLVESKEAEMEMIRRQVISEFRAQLEAEMASFVEARKDRLQYYPIVARKVANA